MVKAEAVVTASVDPVIDDAGDAVESGTKVAVDVDVGEAVVFLSKEGTIDGADSMASLVKVDVPASKVPIVFHVDVGYLCNPAPSIVSESGELSAIASSTTVKEFSSTSLRNPLGTMAESSGFLCLNNLS